MPSPAFSGHNAILKKGATAIAQTRNIRLSQTTRVLDASVHGTSTHVAKKPSLIDGSLTFDFLSLPKTSHAAVVADFEAQTTDSYNITWPDGAVLTFDAFFSELNMSSDQAGLFEGTAKLEIDGAPVWS